MEENITQVVLPKKRPTFLTVLCILTFIFSGGSGLYSVYEYLTFDKNYPAQVAQIEKALETLEDAGMDSGFIYDSTQNGLIVLEKKAENIGLISMATIFFALLSVLGAYLMFKLKKNGFYLYSGANLFWMLVPIALIGFEIGMMTLAMGVGITILFIILYGVNLKHME